MAPILFISMPILCNFENCRNRASYGLYYGKPLRCCTHKEGMKHCTKICQCGKSRPTFNEPGEKKKVCCSECRTSTMVDVSRFLCPCGKNPIFNEPGNKKAVCCFDCRTETMIDVVNRRCPCGNRAMYNDPGESKALYCAGCKTDAMVDVVNSRCPCGKGNPIYNEPDQNRPIFCSNCKNDSMVNVLSKRCLCGKAIALYNEPGQSRPKCCSACKNGSMIDVVSTRCKCGKHPLYNEPGETKPKCCSKCKTETMVNVVSPKCPCGKRPLFNEPRETKPICCLSCKKNTMVDVVSRRCPCGKRPVFNEPGQSKPICCIKCKTPTMIDVYNNMCKGEKCHSHGNKKYKNYCSRCFSYLFPLDPLTFQIRCKTKEIAVRDFINSRFQGFQHDKTMETGNCDCTIRRRIDHRCLINDTLLVIETDENQHKSYDKMDEETRYDDLFMAFSGKWIYIRYNPDKYKNTKGESKNPTLSTRLPVLEKEIQKHIDRIQRGENTELVERVYLFYDGYT